ncbi:2Fe-2S iron-sulfur cluster-binding protein, partial [Thalassococcus lentus]
MSERIRFELDGEMVEAEAGQTLWDVCAGRGFRLPHLCHKPEGGYRADGNCRACMVEI